MTIDPMHKRRDLALPYDSRVRGCLFGGAIGDALGSAVEFMSLAAIRSAHGSDGIQDLLSSEISDDTQMTLFTAEGLMRSHLHRADLVTSVHDAYDRWFDTQQFKRPMLSDEGPRTGWLREQTWLYARRAPGNACLSGLQSGRRGLDLPAPGAIGQINPGSKGCGTVMRSAPFGLLPSDPFEPATRCSYLTHGHPTAALSAGAFALIVHQLVAGKSLTQALQDALERLARYPAHEETTGALRVALHRAGRLESSAMAVESLGQGWIAEESLAIAVYCALAEPDPRQALLLAVNHSGDSDSTGAICGNLLGAWHGIEALPTDWIHAVEGRDTIATIADDFTAAFTSGLPAERAARYPSA